jgi:pimeloyl-ACP methyl ester carboxylesterase
MFLQIPACSPGDKTDSANQPFPQRMDKQSDDIWWMDVPEYLVVLFHPRRDFPQLQEKPNFEELLIPVESNIVISGRLYEANKTAPTILFFHGNGELASDYHDIAGIYLHNKINFVPVDYRGYGKSTGMPTVKAMLGDAVKICLYIKDLLNKKGYTGPLVVMGRSLGSASVLEIASKIPNQIHGIIIESGFAYIIPLIQRLGAEVNLKNPSITERGIDHLAKIRIYSGPTLLLHGTLDQIIPCTEAEILYNASPAKNKKLVKLERADHNTVFTTSIHTYMQAIVQFLGTIQVPPSTK